MLSTLSIFLLIQAFVTPSLTLSLNRRANTSVNPAAISSSTCTDPSTTLDSHDINVATLAICGGIAGAITKCQGSPASTSGASGTARFDLTTTVAGATINVSKGRWEGCIRAARAVCGDSPFEAVCVGGASEGDVNFVLSVNS
ncbi:hypothetical protein P167DRAFT_604113 [Morchella conica CCBAS932]|uniref:Uncharacterized protein n=1 Tax=Morchella conica CCBAS932 TaxID=1392247 RepID=A0A3N4KYC5_9PEZI|nr:hypothetical protein P167DRAFT_604113 [Morchella conica CCBAS932]